MKHARAGGEARGSGGKLVPLGMVRSAGHSTAADTRQHLPAQVPRLRSKFAASGKSPLSPPARLLELGSTTTDLRAKVFEWATHKTTNGAVKIRLLLNHDGLLPHCVLSTESKKLDRQSSSRRCAARPATNASGPRTDWSGGTDGTRLGSGYCNRLAARASSGAPGSAFFHSFKKRSNSARACSRLPWRS